MASRGTMGYVSGSAVQSVYAEIYGAATGGTSSSITVGGINYTLLTFTSDGTLTVTKAGLFDVLMFGGGSAAYRYDAGAHAGGAGGGILQQTVYLSDPTYTVDIGAGGAAGASLVDLSSGLATSLGSIPVALSAIGGFMRTAQSEDQSLGEFGSQIGCIGNGINSGGINNIQGYKGGNSGLTTSSGGGGGSGGVGGNGSGTTGGAGGLGTEVNTFIGGSSLFKASGGGGGGSVTGGAAGSGLGNAGTTSTGNTPAANTAAGGGGGNGANTTGSGGSGILYVRFKV